MAEYATWEGVNAFTSALQQMQRDADRVMKREMRSISVASARAARRAAKVHRKTGQLAKSIKPRKGSLTSAGYKAIYYSRANPRLRHIFDEAKAAAEAKAKADAPTLMRRIVEGR